MDLAAEAIGPKGIPRELRGLYGPSVICVDDLNTLSEPPTLPTKFSGSGHVQWLLCSTIVFFVYRLSH